MHMLSKSDTVCLPRGVISMYIFLLSAVSFVSDTKPPSINVRSGLDILLTIMEHWAARRATVIGLSSLNNVQSTCPSLNFIDESTQPLSITFLWMGVRALLSARFSKSTVLLNSTKNCDPYYLLFKYLKPQRSWIARSARVAYLVKYSSAVALTHLFIKYEYRYGIYTL